MIHIIPILKVGNNASIVVEHKKLILKEGIIARITQKHILGSISKREMILKQHLRSYRKRERMLLKQLLR